MRTITAICLVVLAQLPMDHRGIASADVVPAAGGFEISGTRVQVVVSNGAIVTVRHLESGECHGGRTPGSDDFPGGVGHGATGKEEARLIHKPWTRWTAKPRTQAGSVLRAFRVPTPESGFSLKAEKGDTVATWRGLTDGTTFFPDDEYELRASIRPSGAIAIQALGRSADAGVFGVVLPVTNLPLSSSIYVPSFGGARYRATDLAESLTLTGGAPYLEATALAIEGNASTIGIWAEDAKFRSSAVFLVRARDSLAVALETLAPMPCDSNREITSQGLVIDAVAGDWKAALAPYRDWYAHTFAGEIAERDTVGWPDSISVVLDQFEMDDRGLRAIASQVDPHRTLLHVWEARAADFDRDLPDWSPRSGYGEFVTRARHYGFRTMAYVNAYCVNAASKAVVANAIPNFALTRKWFGIHQWGDPPVEWSTAKAGQLLYLDPLARGWREFHLRQMLEWSRITRTDANYEDVGSIAGDGGNGTIDGLTGAEGGTAMFRELLRGNGAVPMATEHTADHMAFAARWSMRLPQRWGNADQHRFWMEGLRPVSNYLFGQSCRPWVPVIGAESEQSRVLVLACSDALGGLSQFPSRPADLEARHGVLAHMIRRAKLWQSRSLHPDLRPAAPGPAPTCTYRDSAGASYTYWATDRLQELRDAANHPLYQRVTGVNRFTSALRISGWPAFDANGPIGLSPSHWYVLEPDNGERSTIQLCDIQPGVAVSGWAETTSYAILQLAATPGHADEQTRISIAASRQVTAMTINDLPSEPPPAAGKIYEIDLPARIVFSFVDVPNAGPGPLPSKPAGRFQTLGTGLDRGSEYFPRARAAVHVDGLPDPVLLMSNEGGGDAEVVRDYLFRVPTKFASAIVVTRTTQRRFGNGAIVRACINGREVLQADFASGGGSLPADGMTSQAELWSIPLGSHAGQMVLLSLCTNGKSDDNSDQIWISLPNLADDSTQRLVRRPADLRPLN